MTGAEGAPIGLDDDDDHVSLACDLVPDEPEPRQWDARTAVEGETMLASAPGIAFLPSTDLSRAQRFFESLGLHVETLND